MKKNYSKILFFFFLLFSLSAKPQQQPPARGSEIKFKEYYTVRVANLQDEAQAKQLDQLILSDKRFITCVTNDETRTIRIIAEKGVMIEDIKSYTSRFNLVIVTYSEKYSITAPQGW